MGSNLTADKVWWCEWGRYVAFISLPSFVFQLKVVGVGKLLKLLVGKPMPCLTQNNFPGDFNVSAVCLYAC